MIIFNFSQSNITRGSRDLSNIEAQDAAATVYLRFI